MKRSTLEACLFAGTIIIPTAAFSQAPGDPNHTQLVTEGDTANLGEITVTARRRQERAVDVPISIVVQSEKDLTRAGIVNIGEIGRITPGLLFTTNGGTILPTIRGVGTTLTKPGGETPTAIYIDGVYQTNNFGSLFDIPDVSRVEVLKGPQGTLFGRNANAGAIAIYTRDPSFTLGGSLSVSDGEYLGKGSKSANEMIFKGDISVPIIDDKIAFSNAVYYRRSQGFLVNDRTGGSTGGVRSLLVHPKLLIKPTENLRITLSGMYSRSDNHEATAYTALEGNSQGAFYPGAIVPTQPWHTANNATPNVSIRSKLGIFRAEWDIADVGTLSSETSYQYTKAHQIVPIEASYSPACEAAFKCITASQIVNTKTLQQELLFSSKGLDPISFVAGVFYIRDKLYSQQDYNPPVRPDGTVNVSAHSVGNDGSITNEAVAGFGEITWDVTRRIHLTAGGRYGWEQKSGVGRSSVTKPLTPFPNAEGQVSYTSFLPRLSARYDLASSASVYATYSKGFKSGVIDTGNFTPFIAKPEKLTSYEVGFKLGRRAVSLDVAAFHYDIKDLQVVFFNGATAILTNAGGAKVDGVDVAGTLRFARDWTFRAGASWIPHAKYNNFNSAVVQLLPNGPSGMKAGPFDASGHRLLKTPKISGNISLGYEHEYQFGTVDFSTDLAYSTVYDWELLQRVRTLGYATVGAQIGIQPRASNLRIALYGKNLTNKAYIESTLLTGEADAVRYAAPRQIGVTLGYKFGGRAAE